MSESLISRKELQQMYRKGTLFDPAAEDLLLKLGEDFFIRVMELACKSASLRESSSLEIEDIKIILEKYWSIKLPEFEKEDSSKQTRRSAAKSKREANVRKVLNTRGK
jgi:transcription initiation factor TFIID subunit TAF12